MAFSNTFTSASGYAPGGFYESTIESYSTLDGAYRGRLAHSTLFLDERCTACAGSAAVVINNTNTIVVGAVTISSLLVSNDINIIVQPIVTSPPPSVVFNTLDFGYAGNTTRPDYVEFVVDGQVPTGTVLGTSLRLHIETEAGAGANPFDQHMDTTNTPTFVGLILSSNVLVSGTNVLLVESGTLLLNGSGIVPGFWVPQTDGAATNLVVWQAPGSVVVFDSVNLVLNDDAGVESVAWNSRILKDDGGLPAVDWVLRTLSGSWYVNTDPVAPTSIVPWSKIVFTNLVSQGIGNVVTSATLDVASRNLLLYYGTVSGSDPDAITNGAAFVNGNPISSGSNIVVVASGGLPQFTDGILASSNRVLGYWLVPTNTPAGSYRLTFGTNGSIYTYSEASTNVGLTAVDFTAGGGGRVGTDTAMGQRSALLGGYRNRADVGATDGVVFGGQINYLGASQGAIIAGLNNSIAALSGANNTIMGGELNGIQYASRYSSIVGGYDNQVGGAPGYADYNFIGGGYLQEIYSHYYNSMIASVRSQTTSCYYSVMLGARASTNASSDFAFMAPTINSQIRQATNAAVLGGSGVRIQGVTNVYVLGSNVTVTNGMHNLVALGPHAFWSLSGTNTAFLGQIPMITFDPVENAFKIATNGAVAWKNL